MREKMRSGPLSLTLNLSQLLLLMLTVPLNLFPLLQGCSIPVLTPFQAARCLDDSLGLVQLLALAAVEGFHVDRGEHVQHAQPWVKDYDGLGLGLQEGLGLGSGLRC